MYHDIGKMDSPLYFIENQTTGINPHDELTFDESATIIIEHVINGIEKARKNNLPEQIIDFIRTHHGTRRTEYFYTLAKQENPELIERGIFVQEDRPEYCDEYEKVVEKAQGGRS
jgi:putative nucleotidyltransferase with HDIG domain